MGKTITEKIFEAHLKDEPFEGTRYYLSMWSCAMRSPHRLPLPIWYGEEKIVCSIQVKLKQ